MGEGTQVLLVARRAFVSGALGCALLAACRGEPDRGGNVRIDPRAYDAFFLWAGVDAPAYLDRARTVYLLAGEVRHREPLRFVSLRATPRERHAEVWLTVRVERLDWSEGVHAAVLQALALWEAAGSRLAGLQIDFDAATRGIEDYARFLAGLRSRLPVRWRLSVTGLLDWSAHGDPAGLAGLAGVVDEVVIQTYQGRATIPGYERYLASLRRLPLPYRIGLVEDGEWRPPAGLEQDPDFRGYVVFLLGG